MYLEFLINIIASNIVVMTDAMLPLRVNNNLDFSDSMSYK